MSSHPSRTVVLFLSLRVPRGGGLVHTRNWKSALRSSHSSSSGPIWTPNSIGDQRLGFRGGSRVRPNESPGAHGLLCLPELAPSPRKWIPAYLTYRASLFDAEYPRGGGRGSLAPLVILVQLGLLADVARPDQCRGGGDVFL